MSFAIADPRCGAAVLLVLLGCQGPSVPPPRGAEPSLSLPPAQTSLEAPPEGPGRVLATVAGAPVSVEEVYPLLFLSAHDVTMEAVRQAVVERLTRLEAARVGASLEPEALDREADRLLEDFRQSITAATSGKHTLPSYVQEVYGFDEDEYRRWVRRSVSSSLLLERLILYEMAQHPRIQVRLIRVKTAAEAEELLGKLRRGADFSVLARQESDDPSAPEGGLYPPLPADLGLDFLDDIASLQPGEYDKVQEMETAEGTRYRVLQVVNRFEPDRRSFQALEEGLERELDARLVSSLELETWMRIMEERYAVVLYGLGAPDE